MRNVILGVSAAVALALYPGVARADESGDWSGLKAVRAVAGVAAVKGFEVAAVPRRSVITPEQYRAYDPYQTDKAVAAKAAKEYAPRAKQAAQQAQVNRVLSRQAAGTAAAISRARSLGAPATSSVSGTYWWYVW